mgnify:CR=1 FL=1
MINLIRENWTLAVLSFLVLLIATVIFMMIGFDGYVERTCLQHGYPDYRIVQGMAYCVKRVENTDIVVPFDDLK